MNPNPATVLALITDLYSQIGMLADENTQLRALLAEKTEHESPAEPADPEGGNK